MSLAFLQRPSLLGRLVQLVPEVDDCGLDVLELILDVPEPLPELGSEIVAHLRRHATAQCVQIPHGKRAAHEGARETADQR